ncbi:hypothetical protein [Candidatus Odyssella thessalonicensis]|nr:hypothetical protein [Candidatus Odyssella thessalonicensis]
MKNEQLLTDVKAEKLGLITLRFSNALGKAVPKFCQLPDRILKRYD